MFCINEFSSNEFFKISHDCVAENRGWGWYSIERESLNFLAGKGSPPPPLPHRQKKKILLLSGNSWSRHKENSEEGAWSAYCNNFEKSKWEYFFQINKFTAILKRKKKQILFMPFYLLKIIHPFQDKKH